MLKLKIASSSDVVNLFCGRLLHQEISGWTSEMNAFKNLLTPAQETRLRALDAWHRALENRQLRMDCPDAYHDELLRQADEIDRLGIVTWTEWRDLRIEADQAYLRAIAGDDYQAGNTKKLARIDHVHR
jgi:hypothetical protein